MSPNFENFKDYYMESTFNNNMDQWGPCQYFCMWCYCSKEQICDFSCKYTTLSILKMYNSLNLYITLQTSISILVPSWPIQRCPLEQVKNLSENTFEYKEKDLCPFIPYDDMPVDDLHLRIRISHKLFNQVAKIICYILMIKMH